MTAIAVIDNGGQFTHLEQRALRELGVQVTLVDNETAPSTIEADGIVLSGGPDITAIGRAPAYLDLPVPVLGICLGMQIMAEVHGGTVGSGEYGGYADVTVEITDPEDPIVGPLAPETQVWASHADEVTAVPEGFHVTATSGVCGIEAMSDPVRQQYGVQWHPEVAHTAEGTAVFEHFIEVCDAA
jgi:GMP synthase (glutamine-hydrolyzing), N-terminal domain or A subunit